MHFGAVDYDATVYVNGVQVAHHLGGYDAFTAEVTSALRGSGPQDLVVGVHDANQGTYTLYVNGQPQAKVLNQCLGDPSSGPLAVGRGLFGGNKTDYWPGTIDQVHVWNWALSAADVAALYQSGN